MSVADAIGRTVIAPAQLLAGLFTALIGTPPAAVALTGAGTVPR